MRLRALALLLVLSSSAAAQDSTVTGVFQESQRKLNALEASRAEKPRGQ